VGDLVFALVEQELGPRQELKLKPQVLVRKQVSQKVQMPGPAQKLLE
jgi:hypothetical protein